MLILFRCRLKERFIWRKKYLSENKKLKCTQRSRSGRIEGAELRVREAAAAELRGSGDMPSRFFKTSRVLQIVGVHSLEARCRQR